MEYKTVTHVVRGHKIEVRLPSDPEAVLAAAVEAGVDEAGVDGVIADEGTPDEGASDPYWCLVWAAAPHTADLILQGDWPPGTTALEIGCGVGLTGIVAERAGLDVTWSDYSKTAVEQALVNARANGIVDPTGLVLDWKSPVDQQYDLIFGSDILYDRSNHAPVLDVLSQMLTPGGQAWIGDMGRYALEGFVRLAADRQWQLNIVDEKGDPLSGPRPQSFQMLKLQRPHEPF